MLSIVKGPYLQWPTRESIAVMWETSCPSSGQAVWCETEPVHSGLGGRLRTCPDTARTVADEGPTCIHRLN